MAKNKSYEPRPTPKRYKYLCPACTNEAAFLSNNESFGSMTCPHCGKGITFDSKQVVELRPGERGSM
jgi:transcription elongation factor Elf1